LTLSTLIYILVIKLQALLQVTKEKKLSLENRRKEFGTLCNNFVHKKPDPLIAVAPIKYLDYLRLHLAIMVYMSKCLPKRELELDESALLKVFSENKNFIKNCTPNGMLVPKRHLILEYNLVVQAFFTVMNSLRIGHMITSWHIPLNIRFKDSEVNQENLKRHHPTEHIHSDSWAGESADSVTVMIPLLGDTERNRVDYYSPPEDFEENWLGPLPSYQDGAHIAAKYRKVEMPFPIGYVNLTDFASLHASARYPNAGPRVSIDTTFTIPRNRNKEDKEKIHPWRENERISHQELGEIGETKLFFFPDSEDDQVDSKGGFKHPTNLIIKNLL